MLDSKFLHAPDIGPEINFMRRNRVAYPMSLEKDDLHFPGFTDYEGSGRFPVRRFQCLFFRFLEESCVRNPGASDYSQFECDCITGYAMAMAIKSLTPVIILLGVCRLRENG